MKTATKRTLFVVLSLLAPTDGSQTAHAAREQLT